MSEEEQTRQAFVDLAARALAGDLPPEIADGVKAVGDLYTGLQLHGIPEFRAWEWVLRQAQLWRGED